MRSRGLPPPAARIRGWPVPPRCCWGPCSRGPAKTRGGEGSLKSILEANGFDPELHEQIRSDLRTGRIGLAQNRLPPSTVIEDVAGGDVLDTCTAASKPPTSVRARPPWPAARSPCWPWPAERAAAGPAGPAWSRPCTPSAASRASIAISSRSTWPKAARPRPASAPRAPVVVSTSYLTHEPIERFLQSPQGRAYPGPLLASPGRSVGLRMIPMPRDLRFAWEEMPQQILDVQAQKVRESLHASLIGWAEAAGGGSDYTDNVPLQCLHPTGHWFEVPNMLRNGTLARLLARAAAVEVSAPAQHRHAGGRSRSGPAGPAHPQRGLPELRGHPPADRRSRRRPGPRQRPRPPGRGPGHAPRGRRIPPELLQLANDLDFDRSPARRFRAVAPAIWPTSRRSRRPSAA